MTGKDLIMGMNYLDDAFINEAETKHLKKRKIPYVLWGCTAAACLGLVTIAAVFLGDTGAILPDGFAVAPSNVAIQSPSNGLGQNTIGYTDTSTDTAMHNPPDGIGQDTIGFTDTSTDVAMHTPSDGLGQDAIGFTGHPTDTALQNPSDGTGQNISDTSVGNEPAVPLENPVENATSPATPEPIVSSTTLAKKIHVNELSDLLMIDAARMYYDPALYDDVIWNREDIISYYGKDLAPAYIPASFTASSGNGTAKAIIKKDGTVVEDTVYLNYSYDLDADGYPVLNGAKVKGISLTASKLGILNDCIYVFSSEMESSEIGGISVMIGHRSMTYGPYDPETHAPSGYYDLYVAEFECDGIEYEIVAERMELEELVKVVTSIISGSDEFYTQDR